MQELKTNDLIIFENRIYKVTKKPYHRNDDNRGLRVMIDLLKPEELNKLLIDNLKGGNF
jgi:hypothetical protein